MIATLIKRKRLPRGKVKVTFSIRGASDEHKIEGELSMTCDKETLGSPETDRIGTAYPLRMGW